MRTAILGVVWFLMEAFFPHVTPLVDAEDKSAAASAWKLDRMVLPIPDPNIPRSTVLDARHATPPRFEVKAPERSGSCDGYHYLLFRQ